MAVVAILLIWCLCGVLQGTVLAPLLFLCYSINDLPKNISSKVRLYADDVLLYNTIHTKENCLQKYLNTLHLWADKWQMMLTNQY